MASDYPSVDEFVAAYLASHDAHCGVAPSASAPAATQPPMAGQGGLQQPLGTAAQQCHAAAPLQPPCFGGAQAKWVQQGPGDVYMQPYDQAAHQAGLNQLPAQQADWQLQQQQLQLLHQQQQQQQAQLQHQQQQQRQHQLKLQAVMQQAGAASSAAAASAAAPKQAARRSSSGAKQGPAPGAGTTTTTGKRNSRSKSSSSSGRKTKQEQPGRDAAAAAAVAGQVVVKQEADAASFLQQPQHKMGAAPMQDDAAALSFTTANPLGMQNGLGTYGQQGNLASVLLLQQQAQAKQQQVAAQALQLQMQQQQQQQQQGAQQADNDEPDMSHLTVMQRYHARRKLAVQRMEREVEEKIAQLAVLEQENRQLKWQAHILENMLLDMDKQVELMSSEDMPDPSQWLTLLGMGTSAAAGSSGMIARTLHKMLAGASTVDLTGWTAQDCRRKWLAYLEALRPLVEEAEAAQAAYRAQQASSGDQHDSAAAQQQRQQQPQRRPRRAAAQAAVAVIKQEAAEVLGVSPLPVCPLVGAIPDVPAPPSASAHGSNPVSSKSPSSSPLVPPPAAAAAGGDPAGAGQPMEGVQRASSSSSAAGLQPAGSEHSQGSISGSEVSHGPAVEGVPAALLAKVEELVMQNFYWLLAIMTRNPLLTYEFISVDLVEGSTPLPPAQHELWVAAVDRTELTLEQLQECSTCLQVSHRCMAKVFEERAEISAAMQPSLVGPTGPNSLAWLSYDMLNQNQADVTVERMRANVRKESVVRNLVGFYCINVISLYQLAKLSLATSPWFCMAWRVAEAAATKLNKQLAAAAAAEQGYGHNTRSSARLAAQR